jgi:chemotaxis protein MotA
VLGVVKTMGSIDEPPADPRRMIGSALVGTFLGVLLAYGIVGPMASRLKQVIEADAAIYHVVKQIIIASLHGHPQPLVIEARARASPHANPAGLRRRLRRLRAAEPWPRVARAGKQPAAPIIVKKVDLEGHGPIMAAPGRSPMPIS